MATGLPRDIEQQIQRQASELLIRGRRFQRFDRIREREFWSCFLFAPGIGGVIPANSYPLFQTIAGGTGQGYSAPLTLRESNWPQNNRIADNFNLVVRAYHCQVRRPPTVTQVYREGQVFGVDAGDIDLNVPLFTNDCEAVAKGFTLNIKYLTNSIPIGLLSDFPAAGGAYGWTQSTRQTPGAAAPLSGTLAGADNRPHLPVPRNATSAALERRMKIGTLLQHGETFSMEIVAPEAITLAGPNPAAVNRPELNQYSGAVEVRVGFWALESFVERS